MAQKADEYDPSTLSVDPGESHDLLKVLYQNLIPQKLRHDLGEYYTPDWLASHVLDLVAYDGNPDTRVLDPGCGSGTFLVEAINRIRQWFSHHRYDCGFSEEGLIQRILNNVVGFDLNPLAVMASRVNYLRYYPLDDRKSLKAVISRLSADRFEKTRIACHRPVERGGSPLNAIGFELLALWHLDCLLGAWPVRLTHLLVVLALSAMTREPSRM